MSAMTEFGPFHVQQRLVGIAKAAKKGDFAEAHQLECELFYSTLAAIRDGNVDAKQMATLALKSATLDLHRWAQQEECDDAG